jgi:acyl CoA:acetate/3-ketoacid CoA transferase alpha subunit
MLPISLTPSRYVPSATLIGTLIETGGIPQLWSKKQADTKQTVITPGVKRESATFDGKKYIFEPAIHGDVGILRAWKVDKAGNCVFRYVSMHHEHDCWPNHPG